MTSDLLAHFLKLSINFISCDPDLLHVHFIALEWDNIASAKIGTNIVQ